MNTLLPLNEIYGCYLDLYFLSTQLYEPPRTRSELEHALKLLPAAPEHTADPASWLADFAPTWLRGELDAEPFPNIHEANARWRESQRNARQQREDKLRERVGLAEEARLAG